RLAEPLSCILEADARRDTDPYPLVVRTERRNELRERGGSGPLGLALQVDVGDHGLSLSAAHVEAQVPVTITDERDQLVGVRRQPTLGSRVLLCDRSLENRR